MKRVKSACICQTLHFTLKDGLDHLYAVKQVKEEVATYKKNMERNHTKYKIVEQTEQPDRSAETPPPPAAQRPLSAGPRRRCRRSGRRPAGRTGRQAGSRRR